MYGLAWLEGFVTGAATSILGCLLWRLLGPELTIIFAGAFALGIALNLTPYPELEPDDSPPPSPLLRSWHLKHHSVPTSEPVCVTPDSPELFPRPRKRLLQHLEAVRRYYSSDEGF